MSAGYVFVAVGLVSFAGMGIVHKLGDRCSCNPRNIALFAMTSSCLLSLLSAAVTQTHGGGPVPWTVPLIAASFGVFAALGLWLFQCGLRYGRIATSWLLINLSSGIPTALSVLVYGERLSPVKAVALLLILTSLVLLWWDRSQERSL